MKTKHTPGPWKLDFENKSVVVAKDCEFVATCEDCDPKRDSANAALIVRAVNSHEELLAIGKEALSAIIDEAAANFGDSDPHPLIVKHAKIADRFEVIIARAEGRA